MSVLSGLTCFVFNLFGMPFSSVKGGMMLEVDFLDEKNNVVASYQSQYHKKKNYYALYYGYANADYVSVLQAYKMCLEDINHEIKSDIDKLKNHFAE